MKDCGITKGECKSCLRIHSPYEPELPEVYANLGVQPSVARRVEKLYGVDAQELLGKLSYVTTEDKYAATLEKGINLYGKEFSGIIDDVIADQRGMPGNLDLGTWGQVYFACDSGATLYDYCTKNGRYKKVKI